MGLESLARGDDPRLNNSISSLHSLETDPKYVQDSLSRHAFEVGAFKNLRKKVKDEGARKELEDLVMKYTRGMVVDSEKFKRAHNQYHVGKMGRILGTGAAASGLMYALPGRFYPQINGVGDALKYLIPFSGKSIAKDASKYVFLRGIKGIGSTLFTPFMYASGAYALYKLVKGLIKRKKNKNERSRLVKSLSDEELYNTLEELKKTKNIKEDYSSLMQPGRNYGKAA